MYILGINAFHGDSSACLLHDGRLVAAVEEERFRRTKHWAGFPVDSIQYCLKTAGISISAIDHVAINQDSSANLSKKIAYSVTHRPDLSLVLDRIRNKKKRSGILELLAAEFPGEEINAVLQPVEHHVAHLSSAFHCSPFDSATAVSVDGFGDFASAAWGKGNGIEIDVEDRVYFPHSLGVFYQALTQFLGFPKYGDEYKVMGLAAYGKPEYLPQMREIVNLQPDGSFRLNLDYFHHHNKKLNYEWEGGSPNVGALFSSRLSALLGPRRTPEDPLTERHWNIAHSVQAMYEEAFFHLLNSLHRRHGGDALAVAGGCGMNSVANGHIRHNTPYRRIYIQAAAGDAGGALGAALTVWHGLGNKTRLPMRHALWGPEFSAAECAQMVARKKHSLESAKCTISSVEDSQKLCDQVVDCILHGGVIGWFQGRMEWGPRALGNRSILCDPRRTDMKDILNLKIKRREPFRPFAPSILREYVVDWFEEDDDVPFMMKVYPIRKEKQAEIPAVTHVDGTGRLQTVHKETNPLYWQLIETFRQKTGVPMLLNTSFNENEPIVCDPDEALDCFLRTDMDMLVLGHIVVTRIEPSLSGISP
jgi:carbamoyltransferase